MHCILEHNNRFRLLSNCMNTELQEFYYPLSPPSSEQDAKASESAAKSDTRMIFEKLRIKYPLKTHKYTFQVMNLSEFFELSSGSF